MNRFTCFVDIHYSLHKAHGLSFPDYASSPTPSSWRTDSVDLAHSSAVKLARRRRTRCDSADSHPRYRSTAPSPPRSTESARSRWRKRPSAGRRSRQSAAGCRRPSCVLTTCPNAHSDFKAGPELLPTTTQQKTPDRSGVSMISQMLPDTAGLEFGRGSRIRTDDHQSPRLVRYQAALYPG